MAVLGETQRLGSLPALEPVQLTAYNGPSGIPPAGKPVKDVLVNEQVQSLSQQLAHNIAEQFDSLSNRVQVIKLLLKSVQTLSPSSPHAIHMGSATLSVFSPSLQPDFAS